MKKELQIKSVFEFQNYRTFLRHHYNERKKQNPSYSFRFFANKAGLASPNYYKLVMDGTRNLTHKNIVKFIKGLSLSSKEAIYFENLVGLNQAKTSEEKNLFAKNLELLKKDQGRGLLTQDQYNAVSLWYPFVIKELAMLETFYAKPKWIAARLDYKITPQEAKEAVELLERLQLIKVHPKTKAIKVLQQSLQTPDLVQSDAVKNYHEQMIELSKEALEKQSSQERCFSALTVAVAKEDLPQAFAMIHGFRNQLDTFFTQTKKANAVYQLNLNLFRLDADVE